MTVVIPTRDRRDRLRRTLDALAADELARELEVVVVDDGSGDGTASALGDRPPPGLALRVLEQPPRGPGAARNRGVAAARAEVCLLLGDDVVPAPGTLRRHLDHHRRHREPEAAMLGPIVPAPPLDRSPFMRWLHTSGAQFGYDRIEDPDDVPPRFFYANNASLKRELLRSARGFSEDFGFGYEELELGLRLAALGMRLRFDPDAVATHDHPAGLAETLARMRLVGRAYRLLVARAPDQPLPRRPGLRHRAGAAGLSVLLLAGGGRLPAVREEAWRFLCDEAHREAYWELSPPSGSPVRIGRLVARLALRDPAAADPRAGA